MATANQKNLLKKYPIVSGIWALIILFLLKKPIGTFCLGAIILIDRVLNISDSFSPVIMWAILGLFIGLICGGFVARNKYKLEVKTSAVPIVIFILFILLLFFINDPFQSVLVKNVDPLPDNTIVVADKVVPEVTDGKYRRERTGTDEARNTTNLEIPDTATSTQANLPSINEDETKTEPTQSVNTQPEAVMVLNKNDHKVELRIRLFSIENDTWGPWQSYDIPVSKDYISFSSIKTTKYQYYVKDNIGSNKYDESSPMTVTKGEDNFLLVLQ